MKLEHILSRELLKGNDMVKLRDTLSNEVSRSVLKAWFHCKMREKDLDGANQVLIDMIKLEYEVEELVMQLYHAENAKVRRVV